MSKKLLLAGIGIFISFQVLSQSLLQKEYTLPATVSTIGDLLDNIQQQAGVSFSYNSSLVNRRTAIEIPSGTYLLNDLLSRVFDPQGIQFILQGNQFVLVPVVFSAEPVLVKGSLMDSATLLPVTGATVYLPDLKKGIVTDFNGAFTLNLRPGPRKLRFDLLGYRSKTRHYIFTSDTTLLVYLAPSSIEINEVVVMGDEETDPVQNLKISMELLDMESVESMPAMFGEADVIKSLQMLPGIQSGGEGLGGLLVRGGPADQTLVTLNNATIFSPAHFLGFFSVFNPEAIKDVEIYKGGIPARYGGRISSIVNSNLKTGSSEEFKASGGVGLISSRLSLEGPLFNNKASFFVSARRSYFDLLMKLIPDSEIRATAVYFFDLNSTIQYKLNEKNRFLFYTYNGDDVARFYNLLKIKWGNRVVAGEWLHSFSQNLLLNTSLHYSRYGYGFNINFRDELEYEWSSKLDEKSLRLDFDYAVNRNNRLNFGYQSSLRKFSPVYLFIKENNTTFGNIRLDEKHVLEHALYMHNEQKVTDRLSLQYGIRYTMFHNIGPGRVFMYEKDLPRLPETITDTLIYPTGKIYNTYHGPEPRLIGRYSFSDSSSVKFSYNRMQQFTQVASNATASLPSDRWIPSDLYLKPQTGDQWTLGYFSRTKSEGLGFSAELYYKKMKNQLDFKDGVTVINNINDQNAEVNFNNSLETQLLSGTGWSYGLELMLRKKQGRYNGWVSYTYSRTRRRIEGINKGEPYSPRYDRPHDFSIVNSYKINKRLDIAANWIFTSGSAVTMPEGKYSFEGKQLPYFNPEVRNNSRLADYHRLDLSLTLKQKKNEQRRWQGSWTFSLYNSYMRKNPLFVQFTEVINNDPLLSETDVQEVYSKELKGVKVYFSLIPAITYNFSY